MKTDKTIYIPIASVLVAIVLLIADIHHKNYVSQFAISTSTLDTTFTFEPELYFATVIQVGGVGSDIYILIVHTTSETVQTITKKAGQAIWIRIHMRLSALTRHFISWI